MMIIQHQSFKSYQNFDINYIRKNNRKNFRIQMLNEKIIVRYKIIKRIATIFQRIKM